MVASLLCGATILRLVPFVVVGSRVVKTLPPMIAPAARSRLAMTWLKTAGVVEGLG